MITFIRSLPVLVLLLLVTACGGGSSGGSDDNDNNAQPPVARASADAAEVAAGETTVHLDGSDSSSPNGDITTWEWRFLSRPEDSQAEIDNADAPQASFTPDVPGEYVVRLIVGDGAAESEDTQASRVSVNATNPDPVAVVPDEINWIVGTVQLDGSRSQPPEGGDADQLIYQWELTQKPEGSSAQLDSGNLVYPRFTADKVGLYRAELVVEYGSKTSEPATVDINIVEANAKPMAKVAELEGPILRGDTVILDGSVSEDADGDPLQYRWRFVYRPPGSNAELSSTDTAETSFVVDVVNGYSLELCVFDGVSRDCRPTGVNNSLVELPDAAENTPPVALISPDTYNNKTFEAELGAEMRLDSDSYDIDGDDLSEEWRFVSYPEGFDPEANSDLDAGWSSGFTPTEAGDYTVELTVSDGQSTDSTTQTYTALLGANRSPSAAADTVTGNPNTLVGQQVTLDGEASSDPDDNRLSYDWTLIQRPDNSQVELQAADTAHPTLTPDQPGPYLVSLVVTDEHGVPSRSPAEVVVLAKASNHPPVTRIERSGYGSLGGTRLHDGQSPAFDVEQPFFIAGLSEDDRTGEGQRRADYFTLEGDSYDPDGDELTHLWKLTAEPDGNRMALNPISCANGKPYRPINEETWEEYRERVEGYREWTCKRIGLAPTKTGTYAFEYQVTDGSDFAGPYTATVHAVAGRQNYPTLLLEVFSSFSFNTIPGQGVPYQFITKNTHISQSFFPYIQTLTARTGAPEDEIAGELLNPITMSQVAYLTASGGDYTFDVDTHSGDARFTPKLTDMTHGQEITDGYVLAQGESIQVMAQVEIPDSELPQTSRSQAEALAEALNAADIRWTLNVREQPDWRLEYDAEFDQGPVFLPSEVDFSKIWP